MSKHFEIEVEKLKKKTLYLSAIVEESVQKAIQAFKRNDIKLAKQIIENDDEIDRLEVDLEEECLKVLALYQPVASDLRYIASVIKITNELERIGDLASNICKRLIDIRGVDVNLIMADYESMAEKSSMMLKSSLDALMKMDGAIAYKVCASDDLVDDLKKTITAKIKAEIVKNPENLDNWLNVMTVSRYLERIADHATNIAENVIYMLEGEIVRHRLEGSKMLQEKAEK